MNFAVYAAFPTSLATLKLENIPQQEQPSNTVPIPTELNRQMHLILTCFNNALIGPEGDLSFCGH